MDILLIILGIFIVYTLFGGSAAKKAANINPYEENKCPPHKWSWEEIKTPEGEVQGHRMVCARCGPLSKMMGSGEV